MKITRKFTTAGQDVFATVKWERRSSRISSADGSTVFEMKEAEIPSTWSQLATDIVVSKYFRKAGVPQFDAEGRPELDAKGKPVTGPERSVRQVVHRLVACWKQWGQRHGYFDSKKDAEAFSDELAYTLLNQMAAPNSPQWFNTGLSTAYGITGPAQGHWIADPKTGDASLADDAYTHPQPHACFIQPVRDDLVGDGGIMDLWVREARLFKYGSGTGTNFSSLRGENEPLSGGGRSSGLMSFLRIGDRAASAIKSGGTTRRAAKMVCLDVDHPDILEFVRWKVREELKVAAMVEGLKRLPESQQELATELGLKLEYDFNGEAYYTVSGQNSNNSVRLTDDFFECVERGDDWTLVRRTDGKPAGTIPAKTLWKEICFAAWRCADPGVQFDTTINEWHTCPDSGRINASNPCSEYMFLDNTACNLASLNLLKFYNASTRTFDREGYEHAIRLWTIVLEISVLMAAFPSREIAERSWTYRTLGLGYANLGAMLMQAGIPYDSEAGRAVCAALTSVLTGRAYAASAEMAKELGPFAGFRRNRDSMLRVMRNHRRAAKGVQRDAASARSWEELRTIPVSLDHAIFARSAEEGGVPLANAKELVVAAVEAWNDALRLGEKHGYRNAQTTVIAPTGTIGLLMDCDTTGVEPDFALTKFKKLAGGGHFKIVNQSLQPALRALGYSATQIDDIQRYVMGTLSVDVALPEADGSPAAHASRPTFRQLLETRGYDGDDIVALENELPKVFELRFAFASWAMPERVMNSLGIDIAAARRDSAFNGLRALGLSKAQISALNRVICGTQTVEGAPHLRAEHLPVFDCANTCGPLGKRYIASEGHIRMMAAAQPFISGAISKTINLPNSATAEDIAKAYWLSWTLGLKANALYRDGCKMSQPLNATADEESDASDQESDETMSHARGEVAGEVAAIAAAISTIPNSTSGSNSGPISTSTPVAARDDERALAQRTQDAAERTIERVIYRPGRRRLAETRNSITHRFNVAGHEGYLTVGLYEDGAPGEVFITMAKEGSTIGGLMDSLGTATSVALQYGVPLTSLVNKFAHQRFEPMGITTNREIPFAKSLVDYIFRWLGIQFIPGFREENTPRRDAVGGHDNVKEDAAWPHSSSAQANRAGSQSEQSDHAMDGMNRMTPLGGRFAHEAHPDDHDQARIDDSSPTAPRSNEPSAASGARRADSGSDRMIGLPGPVGPTGFAGNPHAIDRRIVLAETRVSTISIANAGMMGDAPACSSCGHITVRSGTCYKCVNCGTQNGCS